MPLSKSPLSEKQHVFQPCTSYLLRHHMSSIISVCQTFIFQISQISNRSQTQSALWLPITIGYSRWQVLFQALSFPLPPSGKEDCTWEPPQKRHTWEDVVWTPSFPWHRESLSIHCDPGFLPGGCPTFPWMSDWLQDGVFSEEWKSPIFFLPTSQRCLPQWPVTDESPSYNSFAHNQTPKAWYC